METVAAHLRDEIAQIEWELENDEWESDVASGQQAIDARRALLFVTFIDRSDSVKVEFLDTVRIKVKEQRRIVTELECGPQTGTPSKS